MRRLLAAIILIGLGTAYAADMARIAAEQRHIAALVDLSRRPSEYQFSFIVDSNHLNAGVRKALKEFGEVVIGEELTSIQVGLANVSKPRLADPIVLAPFRQSMTEVFADLEHLAAGPFGGFEPLLAVLTKTKTERPNWASAGQRRRTVVLIAGSNTAAAMLPTKACADLKQSGADVYLVSLDHAPAVLAQSCATDINHHFYVPDADAVVAALRTIAYRSYPIHENQ